MDKLRVAHCEVVGFREKLKHFLEGRGGESPVRTIYTIFDIYQAHVLALHPLARALNAVEHEAGLYRECS